MKITIHEPVGFSETGGRSNNEDSIFPANGTATTSNRLFLVCDGVGGEHKGEVASALACKSMNDYFAKMPSANLTLENVKEALGVTLRNFEGIERNDPGTHGMATTMTLLNLQENGVALAHLGDSRIYQIRQGRIIFKTKDHKWVNELIQSGVITEEQAKDHPKRNVITRVVSAGRHDEPEFALIQDIKPNDYFFMCSDGVLEQLYDELLEYHLRANPDNEADASEIMDVIKEECDGKTNDNFSAYLIKIATVETTAPLFQNTVIPDLDTRRKTNLPDANLGSNSPKFLYKPYLLAAACLFFAAGIFYWKKTEKDPKMTQQPKVSIQASDFSGNGETPKEPVSPKEQRLKIGKTDKKTKSQIKKSKQLISANKKNAPDSVHHSIVLHSAVPPNEPIEQKKESLEKDPIVKSEKSDLPEKLKKGDPKPVE